MTRLPGGLLGLCGTLLLAATGCSLWKTGGDFHAGDGHAFYETAATYIALPDVDSPHTGDVLATPSPLTLRSDGPLEYWDLSLAETIEIALSNSRVMRDLGGLVLRSPATVRTVHDPAIQETDPRFGVEAALSAFDAVYAGSFYFEKNDRAINNTFLGGGTRLLQQEVGNFQSQLTKLTPTGTRFSLRNDTLYDANNAPGNAFPSAWTVLMDAEFRHPFLLGGGVDFNRIAGPTLIPGVLNGVLIARTNTDVSLADFEMGVRDFVSDVENAYWDLYFAYRDLDAKIRARDAALETWRRIHALYLEGRRGGEAEKEAQARAQYHAFEDEVQNALTGRLFEGTRSANGSSGGTFRATGGVHVSERRLRLLMGIPVSDGRLIRPEEEPFMAEVLFNWDNILAEALLRRVELRRQKWMIKRREMELVAGRRFLLPTLDGVGRYRWRGFGDNLLRPDRTGIDPFDNAFANLTSGDFQEWQLGVELTFPLGYRRAHAAVRNAELMLARERSILEQQEREVAHDLSNAVADVQRAYTVAQTNFNRQAAARQELAAMEAAYEAEAVPFNVVLESQRRQAEAEIQYHRALVEYTLAIKNVHFEKGTLLSYNGVELSEGGWSHDAVHDAVERAALRSPPIQVSDKAVSGPPVVSWSRYPQMMREPAADVQEPTPPPAEFAPPPAPLPASPEDFGNAAPRGELLPSSFVQPPAIPGEPRPISTPRQSQPNSPNASHPRQNGRSLSDILGAGAAQTGPDP